MKGYFVRWNDTLKFREDKGKQSNARERKIFLFNLSQININLNNKNKSNVFLFFKSDFSSRWFVGWLDSISVVVYIGFGFVLATNYPKSRHLFFFSIETDIFTELVHHHDDDDDDFIIHSGRMIQFVCKFTKLFYFIFKLHFTFL